MFCWNYFAFVLIDSYFSSRDQTSVSHAENYFHHLCDITQLNNSSSVKVKSGGRTALMLTISIHKPMLLRYSHVRIRSHQKFHKIDPIPFVWVTILYFYWYLVSICIQLYSWVSSFALSCIPIDLYAGSVFFLLVLGCILNSCLEIL